MNNLDELKSIWLTAKTDSLPATQEIIHIIKKYRNKILQKKITVIVTALILVAIMIAVAFIYKSKMITTRLGEILIVAAGCILIFSNARSIRRFYDLQSFNNKDFLKFLEKTRKNQIHFYKKTQVAGLALCSAGLLLYIFEPVHNNIFLSIGAYVCIIIYIMALWFLIRRRMFKKHANELQKMIDKLKSLSKQF